MTLCLSIWRSIAKRTVNDALLHITLLWRGQPIRRSITYHVCRDFITYHAAVTLLHITFLWRDQSIRRSTISRCCDEISQLDVQLHITLSWLYYISHFCDEISQLDALLYHVAVTSMPGISVGGLSYQRESISGLVEAWHTLLLLAFGLHVDICFLDQISSLCYLLSSRHAPYIIFDLHRDRRCKLHTRYHCKRPASRKKQNRCQFVTIPSSARNLSQFATMTSPAQFSQPAMTVVHCLQHSDLSLWVLRD